ncbi:hypothetical protein BGZ63DRAFT_399645 [Mariannaea sp. PMI_226]|nr:hypothetical protein BGZ63DRAFT_399645 [Mariannaea sp. PMI_226]
MSSHLSSLMFPSSGLSDVYDIPASPPKAKKKNAGHNTPSASRIMTPTRDSSIGRDIIRDIDIDRNYERHTDATVLSTLPGNELLKRALSPKEESIDPQTLQMQPPETANNVTAVVQQEEPAPASASASVSAETGESRNIDQPQDLGEVEIESFETHRVDEPTSTVDILVKWANGEETWEPEWSLQNQVPILVYKYWDGVGGRDKATDLSEYHVFRVLKRGPPKPRAREPMYQVQWVGYRPSDCTWENKSKLNLIAPEELLKFEADNESASETSTKKLKRGVARASGRPKKRTKTDA